LDTFQLDPGILVLGPLAKAMGRLNPVADTGLALGIGMAREPQGRSFLDVGQDGSGKL